MAEQRMRELGREGGVAWLAERLRRGDLERSMVEHIWRDGAAGMARWLCVVAERKGEQRVREAICERLREWAIG